MAKNKQLIIHNPAKLRRKTIEKVRDSVLAGLSFLEIKTFCINLIVSTEDQIRHLNKSYLGLNVATDVIAFSFHEAECQLSGEIYLGSRQIRRNSMEYGTGFEWELCFSAVHGLLHLYGYDDYDSEARNKMWSLQREILKSIGF